MDNYTRETVNPLIVEGKVDLETVGQTLEDLKKHAYSYLFDLQKDIVGFHKLHLKYEDFDVKRDFIFTHIDLNKVMQYNVSIPFIHHNNRLKFRRSKLYNVSITNDDIEENHDLFVYSYFVFINGYLDYSARLKCREELTSVCLRKEAMTPELREQFQPGADIDILFLPDVGIETLEATKEDLETNFLTFKTSSTIKFRDHVYAFVSHEDGLVKMYQAKVVDGKVVVPEESIAEYEDNDVIKIMITILPNFHEQKVCEPGVDYFENSVTPMPVPAENILTLTRNEDGSFRFNNGIGIEKKYPNVFRLPEGHTDTIYANIYYWQNSSNSHLIYGFDTDIYSTAINILEEYRNGTINENIEKYIPFLYDYDLTNFHKSHDKDHQIESVVYKVNKLFETFKLWSFASQLYYENLSKEINGYIIDTTRLNMREKVRRNNRQEIRIEGYYQDFKEDRYLFIFVNKISNRPLPYKYWIDGVRYIPDEVYRDGALEYVYIPCSLFKETGSRIEIEKSNDVAWKVSFMPNDDGSIIDLKLGKGVIPVHSLFVVDQNLEFVDSSRYKLVVSKNGKEIGEPSSDSKLLLTENHVLKFFPIDETLKGNKVTIGYYERPIQYEVDLNQLNFMMRNLNYQHHVNNIKARPNCIRVFREGRLLPQSMYSVVPPDKLSGEWKIELDGFGSFYSYQVDYIPEGYNEVYSQETVNEKGIIDLAGKIDKPFSVKYFDVYINGYRLLPNQIKKLSDFVIQISDVNTLHNLYIYEKDVTTDGLYSLELEDAQKFLAEQLIEHDDEFIEKIKEHIKDIIAEKDITDITDIDNAIKIIFNELIDFIEKGGVLSTMEITDYIYIKYRSFFESDDVFFIDPNKNYDDLNEEDAVYYIAPRRPEEIPNINDPKYVEEFGKLMQVLSAGKFIDPNVERESLGKGFDDVEEDSVDNVLMVSGNYYTDRYNSEAKNLATKD